MSTFRKGDRASASGCCWITCALSPVRPGRVLARVLGAFCLAGSLTLPGGLAGAQLRGVPAPGEEIRRIFYEAVVFPSDTQGRARVDLLYRVDAAFLVPLKNEDPAFPHTFRRRGDVLVELLDSADISRARQIRRIEAGASSAEDPAGDQLWYSGSASFFVSPGRYTIAIEVDDLESDRRFQERQRRIDVRAPGGDTLRMEEMLLLAGTPIQGDSLLLAQNFGGDVRFGMPGGLAVALPADAGDSGSFTCRVFVTDGPGERTIAVRETTLAVRIIPGVPGPALSQGDSVHYVIAQASGRNTKLAVIPLPFETLPLRTCELEGRLVAGSRAVLVNRRFRLVWPDMPLSLRDVDRALEALRHIASQRVIDSLSRGSFENRRSNLEAFWQTKDPDPSTASNEVMTEYYRRVDEATRSFATLREADGSRTDRGRIFILHGRPARIDRTLDPSLGFQEIWTYTGPSKRFVFVDRNRSGTYVLVSPSQP